MTAPQDLVAFCEEQHPRLVGLLGLYCGDRDMAEEFAQEALARACRDWSKVRRLDAPEAWAYKVGMNLASSYFRRKAIEQRAKRRLEAERPRHRETTHAERAELLDAVGKLPHRQRAALLLHYYLDLSIPQVAQLLECPEGTAKTLVHKAVKRLRAMATTEELEARDVV